MSTFTKAERNATAAKYGLLIGVVALLLLTIDNTFLVNRFLGFYILKTVNFMVYILMLFFIAKNVRNTNYEGYISYKEIFGFLFIMILVAEFISYTYTIIYMHFISPDFLEKVRITTANWMESNNVPEQKINDSLKSFDEQIEQSKHFNLGKMALGYFSVLIFDSIFALILAAILKKERPAANFLN